MEVLLKLTYSAILTLFRFHIFSKLVTWSSGFGEKFGFLARRSESQNCATEIGGESPPEAFAAEEFRDEDEVCNCDKDAIEEEEGTGCLDGNLVGQGRFDRVRERAREPFDESSVREIAREIEKHSDETECGEDEDDDDWVGIERSELEMRFGSAMVFVESTSKCDRVLALASDLKTKLYGLHKIATQGPCLEPQPMVLKVSARAKW